MEGNITESFRGVDNKWCCKTTSEECKVINKYEDASCIGKAISLQEQCPKYEMSRDVCNHHPHDPFRNKLGTFDPTFANDTIRSFIDICNDNRYYLFL